MPTEPPGPVPSHGPGDSVVFCQILGCSRPISQAREGGGSSVCIAHCEVGAPGALRLKGGVGFGLEGQDSSLTGVSGGMRS